MIFNILNGFCFFINSLKDKIFFDGLSNSNLWNIFLIIIIFFIVVGKFKGIIKNLFFIWVSIVNNKFYFFRV